MPSPGPHTFRHPVPIHAFTRSPRMSSPGLHTCRHPVPTYAHNLTKPHITITSTRWLLFFYRAVSRPQGGALAGMPQEDGGRVIESWRVTTTARVRTASYSQTCIYLSSGGTASNKKEETRKYYKRNNRFTASCLVT